MLKQFVLIVVIVLMFGLIGIVYAQDGGSAIAVIGQPDFTSGAPGSSATSLNYPLGMIIDASGGLYLADRNNHRVLYYAPDDAVPDRVYGQFGNFESHINNNDGTGNSGPAGNPDSLSMPTAVALDSAGGLYITDRENHRVLHFAPGGGTTASRVFGQAGNFGTNMVNNDGTGAYGEPSADNIGTYTLGVVVDASDGIYVSDSASHRVLYYANDGNTTADRVYGQFNDFTSDQRNNDGTGRRGTTPSADSLNFPRGLAVDAQGGLYIADRDNHRVLYFANDGNTTADRVYGQAGNFTTNGANNGGAPSADNLNHPKSVAIDAAGGLYIADTDNHRVLYFANDGDTTADRVYGQAGSFTSNAPNNGGSPSASSLLGPQGIALASDGRLYVGDTGNNRILIFAAPG